MLLLIPILLLLAGSAILVVFQWRRPGFGPQWLIACASAILAWLALGYLRLRLPSVFVVAQWKPDTLFGSSPSLLLDYTTWPYAFSLATLTLAVILTSPARIQARTNLIQFAGNLSLGGLGLIAVMAANPLTVILGWAAIDVVDLFILFRLARTPQLGNRIILSFAGRIAGILIVLWSVIVGSRISGYHSDFTVIPPQVGLLLLIGIGFRLGVFPLHLPIEGESKLRRGMGTILRFVPPASALVLLARLPANVVPSELVGLIYGLTLLAAIVSIIQIMNTKNELDARPLWAVALSSLAIACVIRGFPTSSTAWGVTLTLMGGFIFINPFRSRFLTVLSFIGFAVVAGIPFFPLAGGWQGLLAKAGVAGFLMNFIIQCLFLLAVIHLLSMKQEEITSTDKLTQLTIPAGLIILLGSFIAAGIWGWPGSRTQGTWLAGIFSLVIITLWYIFKNKILAWVSQIHFIGKSMPVVNEIYPRAAVIFRMENVYWVGEKAYQLAGRIINFATVILEGDGGILWAMVLLTLLIALVQQGIK